MMTIIDELIVRLGLKNDIGAQAPGVKKNLEDIEKSAQGAESGVEGIGKASKGTASELGILSGKLGSFLALIGGTVALKAFVLDTIQANTQLSYFVRNLGMSAQSVSAWGNVAKAFGGSAEGLRNTFSMLSQEQTKLRMGTSALLPYFAAMGVSMAGGPEEQLLALAERAEHMNRTFAHNIFQQMGIDEGTINAMLQGTAALKGYLATLRQLGPSPEETKHAAEMNTQLVLMEARYKKIGTDLLEIATPGLEKFVALLGKAGAWIQQHEGIAATFSAVALSLGAIGAAAALLSGTTGLATMAIGGVSGAVALLVDDYKAWASGAPSLFDWQAFADMVRGAADAFRYLAEKIGDAVDSYEKWLAQHPGFMERITAPFNIPRMTQEMIPQVEKGIEVAEGGNKPGTIPYEANNPAAVEWTGPNGGFAALHGATGYVVAAGGQKIAKFRTMEEGRAAAIALLRGDTYLGLTLPDALHRWSGLEGAKLDAYISNVQEGGGLSSAVMERPATSLIKGMLLPFDFPGLLGSMGHLAPQPAQNNNIQHHYHIGEINIHTLATDAKGIWADMKKATDTLTFASQANGSAR